MIFFLFLFLGIGIAGFIGASLQLDKIRKNWKDMNLEGKVTALSILPALILLPLQILTYFRDNNFASASLNQGQATVEIGKAANKLSEVANNLNKVLVKNSDLTLETERKKLGFDIINTLYQDFYKFDDHNSLVIRKLQEGKKIEDEFYLGLYLNGFEDVYQQCKTGLLTSQDIRIHFQHLISPLCNNLHVENFILNRDNGLKLLCYKFYPKSNLAKKASLEGDSCR